MSQQATWVVIANGSNAKFFRVVKFPKIEEFEVFLHPESRLRNQDLVSAEEGRTFESTSTARSAYQAHVDPHHVELQKFARLLGERLAEEKRKQSFSRLYLMANPSFLGLLRPHLDHSTKEALVAEVGKDMTDQSMAEIEKHLVNA
jgi:protein required for attachment to host cells